MISFHFCESFFYDMTNSLRRFSFFHPTLAISMELITCIIPYYESANKSNQFFYGLIYSSSFSTRKIIIIKAFSVLYFSIAFPFNNAFFKWRVDVLKNKNINHNLYTLKNVFCFLKS